MYEPIGDPLKDQYFNWLIAKVSDTSNVNYRDLFMIMYETEFVWNVPADRHRVGDGLELRHEFLRELSDGDDYDDYFVESFPCSVLEVLISFANRACFQTELMSFHDWFYRFLVNLGLDDYRRVSRSDVRDIEAKLQTFIWRTYSHDGYGGLFPMEHTNRDQREIEIWYQFCEYLDDQQIF